MAYTGAQRTRLGLYGGARGLYGSFAGKALAPDTGPHNPGEITRLGLAAITRGLYSSFADKAEAAPQVTVTPGGGRRRRYAGYPRRVLIDGKLYTVKSAEEERELLRQWRERLLRAAPDELPKSARITVKRIERRLLDADDRASDWHRQLMQQDEELLALLFG